MASKDGGFHWLPDPVLPVGSAVDFADQSTGWVVSTTAGGEIRHTRDGGERWTLQSEELGYPRPTFQDVDAVDPQRAVVAGRENVFIGSTEHPGPPAMFFTSDGGTTWRRSTLTGFDVGQFPGVEMLSVCVTAAGHGVAAGRHLASYTSPGLLLVTQDAGATWEPPATAPPTARAIEVDCAGERDFWLTDDQRHVQHSPDGGASWRDIATALPGGGNLLAIDFDGPSEGRVLTSGFRQLQIFHTTNGGRHWTSHDIVGSTGLVEVFASMDFRGTRGVIVAQDLHPLSPPRSSFGVAFATADGGATWTETVFPSPINALWDVVLLP